MRTAILVAALLLLPIAAGAQAQNGTGIIVNAAGSTRIAATSATILLQLSSANRTLLDKTKIQPLADALIKAGVDPANIHFPVSLDVPGGATNNFALTVVVAHPSATMVQSGIMTVGTTIASMKDVVLLNSAQVMLRAEHCQDAVHTARLRAIARAHDKAEAIAKDLAVHVGSVVNFQSFEQSASDGSCQSEYNVNGYTGNPEKPQSAQDYVTVPVQSSVTITYGIK